MSVSEKTSLLKNNLDSKSDPKEKKEGLCSSVGKCMRSIQVEPVVLCHAFGVGIDNVFLTNLFVDKVCDIQLNYSSEVCTNLDSGDYPDQENEVQKLVSLYVMYQHFVVFLPMIFGIILLSGWSESHGLKTPLIINNAGLLVKCIFLMACSHWWFLSPEYVLWSLLPMGMTGGFSALFMCVYSFIGLTVDEKSRTTRMSMIVVIEFSAAAVGGVLGDFIFQKYRYFGVFAAQAISYLISVLYIIMYLDNPIPKQQTNEVKTSKRLISGMKNTLTVAFKKREDGSRAKIISHVAIIAIFIGTMATMNFYVLYTRKMFDWKYEDYSYWSAFTMPCGVIGALMILPFLSSVLKMEDSLLGLIGWISAMFKFTLQATAPRGWVMYLASAIGVCGSMVCVATRAALSKSVGSEEVAAVFGK
ncbi:unnamed protein product, partial [Meganyctiphanes norvegica]